MHPYARTFNKKDMTTEEKKMMQPAQDYIRKLQQNRNAGTDDCMLSSDLAREIGVSAPDLHHFLIDVGFLYRERKSYELKLCKQYAGLGYAKTRSHFRYSQKGELIETRFPVWTEKGQEFIKNLIKGSRQKDMIVKIQKQVKKDGKNC
jgi:phage antirepressor YoqD-like protein